MENAVEVSRVLTVEQDKKISMTGVDAVKNFSETQITLVIGKQTLLITGTDLKVLVFSESTGNFVAGGKVTSVKFTTGHSSLKRLFQ